MFDVLFSHIEHKVALSDAEKSAIAAFFTFKKIRKKQFILEEGDICMHLSFVNKGHIKSYRLDEKGNEHISLFGWEGWWISDFYSYINQQPATLYIDAVEDTELFLLSRAQ